MGAFLEKKAWVAYDWVALVIIVSSLAVVMTKIHAYARKRKASGQ